MRKRTFAPWQRLDPVGIVIFSSKAHVKRGERVPASFLKTSGLKSRRLSTFLCFAHVKYTAYVFGFRVKQTAYLFGYWCQIHCLPFPVLVSSTLPTFLGQVSSRLPTIFGSSVKQTAYHFGVKCQNRTCLRYHGYISDFCNKSNRSSDHGADFAIRISGRFFSNSFSSNHLAAQVLRQLFWMLI